MKFELKDFNRNISDTELIDDLKKVAKNLGLDKISSRQYSSEGKYTAGTISVRFGSWNNALEKAGLSVVQQHNVPEEKLFNNIEYIWIKTGRQPVFRDMKGIDSEYSTHQYITKFGTWRKSLMAFIKFINSDFYSNEEDCNIERTNVSEVALETKNASKHKTKRFPSDRLKVQVLMRDGNKCKLCGIEVIGKNIHFDHILSWSKGGETTLENLQILCAFHNLVKGNMDYPEEKQS